MRTIGLLVRTGQVLHCERIQGRHDKRESRMPQNGPPRISVGLPVYNGERYLREALDSLLSQSFADFELIISDNASSDGTREICEHYARMDPRVRYDRLEENLGAAPNYNRLVHMARGEYFKWAAHDDNCYPDFLSKCVSALDDNPDAVLCYPSTHVIDSDGKVVCEYRDNLGLTQPSPHERLLAYLRINFMRQTGMCNPIFGLLRISALRKTRLIQDFIASDRSLLAHLTLLGKSIELPDILFQRRVHAGTSTMAIKSFSDRMAWFNPTAGGKKPRKSRSSRSRFNNHLSMRLVRIRDLYRAITELTEDTAERRRCRRELTKLLITDPKWIYIDLKYSMGLVPSNRNIMQSLAGS